MAQSLPLEILFRTDLIPGRHIFFGENIRVSLSLNEPEKFLNYLAGNNLRSREQGQRRVGRREKK